MDPLSVNPLVGPGAVGDSGAVAPTSFGAVAAQRCCGLSGMQTGLGMDGIDAMQGQYTQLLSQMLQLLVQLMAQGGQDPAGLAPAGAATAAAANTDLAPATPTGTTGAAPADAGVAPATATADTAAGGDGANAKIGPGTRVLEIGDSHTVGTYGQELEKLLERKGAAVERHAAVGTSAGHWINGGHGAQPLQNLIAQTRPEVVIINLGANSRGGVGSDVKRLAQIARSSGAQVIWVGPPRTRQDMSNPASLQKYDDAMRAELQGLGTYISSAPYSSYDGPDGIHYNAGAARKWAQGVAQALG